MLNVDKVSSSDKSLREEGILHLWKPEEGHPTGRKAYGKKD